MKRDTPAPNRLKPAHSLVHFGAADSRPGEFHALVNQVRTGDQEALRRLYVGSQVHVLRVIRHFLHPPLSKEFDAEDLAQETWLTVFLRIKAGAPLRTPAEFLGFLKGIAVNTVRKWQRDYVTRDKRSLAREEPLAETAWEMAGGQDPASLVASEDQWECLLRTRSPCHSALLTALRAGDSSDEAARRTGVSERTVQRARTSALGWLCCGDEHTR
jgi:DNA-directed RNA polymerase specialized sigma24 family protein